MPKIHPQTRKARSRKLISVLAKHNFNQHSAAKALGVSQPALNQRLHTKDGQAALQEHLDSPELKEELIKVGIQGLRAMRTKLTYVKKIKRHIRITTPDHDTRHKYWHDYMTGAGILKNNGQQGGHIIVNIVYGHTARPLNSVLKTEETKQESDNGRNCDGIAYSALRPGQAGQPEPTEPNATEGT